MTDAPEHPKLFISYSWTSPQHKQWVLDLAKKLFDSHVDVKLDQWELRAGHDTIAFMEQMVTDPTIDKVLMIVDKNYAEKANAGKGNVGTETQIISKKVYENKGQEKFVALVLDKDEKGMAYLPVYCQSRMYIDFSEPQNYDEKFKELLGWIFDKPLQVKPERGKPSASLLNEAKIDIKTAIPFRRAIEAIEEGKGNSSGYVADYLESLSDGLEEFRIKKYEGAFDDAVIESIESFMPYRAEFINLISVMTKYSVVDNCANILHKFFEELIPYLCSPKNMNGYSETAFDNFRFIIHELFLYTVAILLKAEKFEIIEDFLSKGYYVKRNIQGKTNLKMSYIVFFNFVESLRTKNNRQKHKQACLLKDRTEGSGIDFQYLMQVDFMLFMRREMLANEWSDFWGPITLLYETWPLESAFEIFVRAESVKYFDKIKGLIGIEHKNDIDRVFDAYVAGTRRVIDVGRSPINIKALMGFENLATTRP